MWIEVPESRHQNVHCTFVTEHCLSDKTYLQKDSGIEQTGVPVKISMTMTSSLLSFSIANVANLCPIPRRYTLDDDATDAGRENLAVGGFLPISDQSELSGSWYDEIVQWFSFFVFVANIDSVSMVGLDA